MIQVKLWFRCLFMMIPLILSQEYPDTTNCHSDLCVARKDFFNQLSSIYGEWTAWTKCAENGNKFQTRERSCKVEDICNKTVIKEQKNCIKLPGNWKIVEVKYKNSNEFNVVLNKSKQSYERLGINLIKPTKKSANFEIKPRIYSKWSRWTICTKSCLTSRYRWCKKVELCGNEVIRQSAYCYTDGTQCETLIQNKIQETPDINNYSNHRGVEAEAEDLHCGLSNMTNFNLKIIGGRPSQNGKWPWIVAVLNRYKEAICGGTLVAPNWVLTAAHCVKRRLYVVVGEYNLSSGNEIRIRVRKSVIHPDYNVDTVDNDVALLKLPNFSEQMVACLPKPRQLLPTKKLCTIIGWGKQSSGDAYGTDMLHEAKIPIVSNQVCKTTYEEYQVITSNMFCAGYRKGRMDTCSGDSGGPLLCKDNFDRWTVFGITSFGEGCGKRGKYGIYTKLPNYVKWIQSVIQIK